MAETMAQLNKGKDNTAKGAGSAVTISSTKYTATSDGYLSLYVGNTAGCYINVALEIGSTSIGTQKIMGDSANRLYGVIYISKGVTMYVGSSNGDVSATFRPIIY